MSEDSTAEKLDNIFFREDSGYVFLDAEEICEEIRCPIAELDQINEITALLIHNPEYRKEIQHIIEIGCDADEIKKNIKAFLNPDKETSARNQDGLIQISQKFMDLKLINIEAERANVKNSIGLKIHTI